MGKVWYVGWAKQNRAQRAYVEEEREKIARWRLMAMLHLGRDEIHVQPAKTASGFTPFIGVDTDTLFDDYRRKQNAAVVDTSKRQRR